MSLDVIERLPTILPNTSYVWSPPEGLEVVELKALVVSVTTDASVGSTYVALGVTDTDGQIAAISGLLTAIPPSTSQAYVQYVFEDGKDTGEGLYLAATDTWQTLAVPVRVVKHGWRVVLSFITPSGLPITQAFMRYSGNQ